MTPVFELPEPTEPEDFRTKEIQTCIISIDVEGVTRIDDESDVDVCVRAVEKFRSGRLDGDATMVHSEIVKTMKIDSNTGKPFDQAAWLTAKLIEIGVHADGTPMKAGEKVRPACETKLTDFVVQDTWWGRAAKYIKSKIRRLYCIPREYSVL